MGFHGNLVKTLENSDYENPTPIQGQAIPIIMEGHDLIGIAQTGTGKTAAFALPIIDRLIKTRQAPIKRGCRALILAPTRELCTQIANSFVKYSKGTGIQIAAVFGGVSYKPQINALIRGVDVLVATPGRLIDHMDEGNIRLNLCDMFVLDEVDQMLDLGFVNPIRKIVKKLPEMRQNLFFSATMPKEIQKFANELLTNPKRVEVAPVSSTAERVEQIIVQIETAKKRSMLSELLLDQSMTRILVFTKTKHGADKVAKHLGQISIRHAVIHGDKSQRARQDALEAFRAGRVRALVATDVAARGIDIKDVTHVINFDMPLTPEAYVHRIGRTARAEASGTAISLCSNEEANLLRAIEKLTAQNITKMDRRKDTSIMADKRLTSNNNEVSEEMSDIRPPKEERAERSGRGDRKPRGENRRDGRNENRGENRGRRNERAERPERPERQERQNRDFVPANDGYSPEAVESDIYAMPRKAKKFGHRSEMRNESRNEGRNENRGRREGVKSENSFGRGRSTPRMDANGRNYSERPQRSNTKSQYNPAADNLSETHSDAPWEFKRTEQYGRRNHNESNRSEMERGEKRPFNRSRNSEKPKTSKFGARSDGGKPSFERPKGRSDRDGGRGPSREAHRTEGSRSERPQYDRQRGDRPQSDRPRGERNFGDRPAKRRQFA